MVVTEGSLKSCRACHKSSEILTIVYIEFLCNTAYYFLVCLPHLVREEELDTQVLQSSVKVGCHLLVFPPGLLQPLEGDDD